LFGGKAFEIPFRFEHTARGPPKIVWGSAHVSFQEDDFLSKVHVCHQKIRIAAAEHGLIRRWRTTTIQTADINLGLPNARDTIK
jgi:hypothetical protein